MDNIKYFKQFINESLSNKEILYSAITALAVINSDFFSFLDDPKQRYLFHTRSFWQSFILELKNKRKILQVDKDHLLELKDISIEKDWNKLKKSVEAANNIKKEFYNIEFIKVKEDEIIITTERNKSIIRSKKEKDKITQKDLEDILGFTTKDIYSNEKWVFLIKEFINLLKKELKPYFLERLEFFTDKLFEDGISIDWDIYKDFKVKGLGVKAEKLPKLYYNKLSDYCKDVTSYKEAFRDYKFFIDVWYNKKNEVLNKGIILNLYKKEDPNRIKELKELLTKKYSLDNKKYYKFNSDLKLEKMPSKNVIEDKENIEISEKIWITEDNSLVLEIINKSFNLKILIGLKDVSPNLIEIKERYVGKKFKLFNT